MATKSVPKPAATKGERRVRSGAGAAKGRSNREGRSMSTESKESGEPMVMAVGDSGKLELCPASEAVDIPVLGFVNEPEAEMRLLRRGMEHCLGPIRARLDGLGLTFEQELEIYNRIPVYRTAAHLDRSELDAILQEVTASS